MEQSVFINNPNVIKFVAEEFDKCYKKENCPEWITFDLFKNEVTNIMFIALYKQCCSDAYNIFTNWSYYEIFGKAIFINEHICENGNENLTFIPDEIILLVITFEKYKNSKKELKSVISSKIISSYENSIKNELDPYLCDDLIRIITSLITVPETSRVIN